MKNMVVSNASIVVMLLGSFAWSCALAPSKKSKKETSGDRPTLPSPDDFKVNIEVVSENMPDAKANLVNLTSDGAVYVESDKAYLINEDGQRYVGDVPAFFNTSDKLFVSQPVMDDDKKVGVWYFYDDATDPKFTSAIPAYVFQGEVVDRADLSNVNWIMPDKDTMKIAYASKSIMWIVDGERIFYVKRGSNEFELVKASGKGFTGEVLGASDTYVAIRETKKTVAYYELSDDTFVKQTFSVPPKLLGEKFALIRLFGLYLAIGNHELNYFLSFEDKEWLEIEDVFGKIKIDNSKLIQARVFDETALIMYEDKIVRLDVDRKKEDGPVVGPIGNISEELANIMTISCGTCHLVRSSGSEKAATPSEFDYLSVDQWKTFVTERNKNEALAYILDNMCPRLSQSVCKTSDTENRKLIEDYIMGLEIE